jgi:NADH:ubiquinone oxidoreductase subunit 5 (subunit L)/multisubunit Na+/H+ antiporter MnhA subunit
MIVLIGFFSKQFVLYSALQNGYYFISLIAIIVSVISASYYLKIIKVLHTDQYYFEDKMLKGAVEENKVPNQSNVLLNEYKEFKEFKEFKEVAIEAEGDSITADIPIVTLILKEPKVEVKSRVG